MGLTTGDLIALVDSLPADGTRTRTLLVLRAHDDGSHDVIDLAWSGLGGGGLCLRLAPVALHEAPRDGMVLALAGDAQLTSLPLHDYGQRKLEFKNAVHVENARPTVSAMLERVTGRTFGAEPPVPEPDLIAENAICQRKRGDGMVWFEVRGAGASDRHFFASTDPLAVIAISYSEEGGLRESWFTVVSETDDLAGPFEWLAEELKRTPLRR